MKKRAPKPATRYPAGVHHCLCLQVLSVISWAIILSTRAHSASDKASPFVSTISLSFICIECFIACGALSSSKRAASAIRLIATIAFYCTEGWVLGASQVSRVKDAGFPDDPRAKAGIGGGANIRGTSFVSRFVLEHHPVPGGGAAGTGGRR